MHCCRTARCRCAALPSPATCTTQLHLGSHLRRHFLSSIKSHYEPPGRPSRGSGGGRARSSLQFRRSHHHRLGGRGRLLDVHHLLHLGHRAVRLDQARLLADGAGRAPAEASQGEAGWTRSATPNTAPHRTATGRASNPTSFPPRPFPTHQQCTQQSPHGSSLRLWAARRRPRFGAA